MLNACLGWSLNCVSLLQFVFHSIICNGSHQGEFAIAKVCMNNTVPKKLRTYSLLRDHPCRLHAEYKIGQAATFKRKEPTRSHGDFLLLLCTPLPLFGTRSAALRCKSPVSVMSDFCKVVNDGIHHVCKFRYGDVVLFNFRNTG